MEQRYCLLTACDNGYCRVHQHVGVQLRAAFARGAEAERKKWVAEHDDYMTGPFATIEKCSVAIFVNRVTALPLPEYRDE